MRGNSESINKPLSAALLLDGVGQRRRRYVETGYHTPPPSRFLCRAKVRSVSGGRTYAVRIPALPAALENLVVYSYHGTLATFRVQ